MKKLIRGPKLAVSLILATALFHLGSAEQNYPAVVISGAAVTYYKEEPPNTSGATPIVHGLLI